MKWIEDKVAKCIAIYCITCTCQLDVGPNVYYGQGSGQTSLGYPYCTGTESSLLICPRPNDIEYASCSHSEDVRVVCPGRQ